MKHLLYIYNGIIILTFTILIFILAGLIVTLIATYPIFLVPVAIISICYFLGKEYETTGITKDV